MFQLKPLSKSRLKMKIQKILFVAIGAMNTQTGLAICSFQNCNTCQFFWHLATKMTTQLLFSNANTSWNLEIAVNSLCDAMCLSVVYRASTSILIDLCEHFSAHWALLPIWLWFEKLFCNGLQIKVQNHFANLTYPSVLIALHSLFSRFSYGFISQYVKSTPDCRKATQAR